MSLAFVLLLAGCTTDGKVSGDPKACSATDPFRRPGYCRPNTGVDYTNSVGGQAPRMPRHYDPTENTP